MPNILCTEVSLEALVVCIFNPKKWKIFLGGAGRGNKHFQSEIFEILHPIFTSRTFF